MGHRLIAVDLPRNPCHEFGRPVDQLRDLLAGLYNFADLEQKLRGTEGPVDVGPPLTDVEDSAVELASCDFLAAGVAPAAAVAAVVVVVVVVAVAADNLVGIAVELDRSTAANVAVVLEYLGWSADTRRDFDEYNVVGLS